MKVETVVRWLARAFGTGASAFLFVVLASSGGRAEAQAISQQAAAQIQALLAEKDARTPAQSKIDSNLLYAARMDRGQAIAAGITSLRTGVEVATDSSVIVDIVAHRPDTLTDTIRNLGGQVIDLQPAYRSIRARMPLQKLETLAAIPSVVFIRPKQDAIVWREVREGERVERVRAQLAAALARKTLVGSVTSEGDVTHRANQVRSTLGVTGAGVKVGVLSDGVASLGLLQASGDLPAVTVLPGQAGEGDERTAMLEIVHDLAPGAALYFATALPDIATFAQNIRDLRTAGCDIIIDDVGYFAETPFQKGQAPSVVSDTNGGIVTQAVVDVTAAGALYFSSAGNSGSKDKSTSGTWEGDFVGGGQAYDVLTAGGFANTLHWSDPLGGSSNDYDLFLLNSTGTAVRASSTNVQNGTQDPFEITGSESANDRIVIVRRTGAASRFLHLDTQRGTLSISTAGSTHGHNAPPGPYAFSVAATPASGPIGLPPNPTGPYPGVFNASNTLELFSSDGPRRFFYNADSTPITPGDVSSTGGETQQKPDLTAADGNVCG